MKNFNRKYFVIVNLLIIFLFVACIFFIKIKQDNFLKEESRYKADIKEIEQREVSNFNKKIKEQNDFLNSIDFITDNGIHKFVSAKKSFNDKGYVPKNLVNISTDFIIDGKGGDQKLRKIAKNALNNMAEDYYKDTGKKIVVVSAYRSYLYQKGIKNRGCPDNLCAKAGYSEHQTGLTADLWAASNYNSWQKEPYKSRYKWLKENAYKYGFHNTYQKGLDVDTYEIEPWHWRYVGIKLAKYLYDNDLTIAELYKKMEQN